MRQALHVVGQIAGELDDGRAEPGLGPDARPRESRVDERGELVGRNLLEPHHRPGLVEGRLGPSIRSIRLGSDPANT